MQEIRRVRLFLAGKSKAGKAMQNVTFHASYTLDLKRAHKTCQIILEHNQADSVMAKNVKQDKLLREKHFGVFEGT